VKRGGPASPVRVLGARVLKGAGENHGSESEEGAAEAVLPECNSKAA
jgi:hypothetical protein